MDADVNVRLSYLDSDYEEIKTEEKQLSTSNGKALVTTTPPDKAVAMVVQASAEQARAEQTILAFRATAWIVSVCLLRCHEWRGMALLARPPREDWEGLLRLMIPPSFRPSDDPKTTDPPPQEVSQKQSDAPSIVPDGDRLWDHLPPHLPHR